MPPERLDNVLRSHWLDPCLLHADDFAQSFLARGKKMLTLIGQAMGRELGSGEEVFLNALREAGVAEDEEARVTGDEEARVVQDEYDEEPEYEEYGEAA